MKNLDFLCTWLENVAVMIDFCGGSYVKISIALCWVELAHGTAVLSPAELPTLWRRHLSLDQGWIRNNLVVPLYISYLLTCILAFGSTRVRYQQGRLCGVTLLCLYYLQLRVAEWSVNTTASVCSPLPPAPRCQHLAAWHDVTLHVTHVTLCDASYLSGPRRGTCGLCARGCSWGPSAPWRPCTPSWSPGTRSAA